MLAHRQAGGAAATHSMLAHRQAGGAAAAAPTPARQQCQRRSVATAAQLGRRAVLGGLCGCSGCSCACSSSSRPRRELYDKYFALNMAVGMADYEAAILPVKQALFQQLFASVGSAQQLLDDDSSSSGGPISLLEVGIGTGPNLSYLPLALTSSSSSTLGDLTVTGLDPNTSMFGYAREAAATAGLSPEQLRLVDGDAQAMPFESNSMDAAVMTLVLCSVQQPAAVLSELLRVLRPGGQLLIIEHVIASQAGLLQLQQRLFNPLQRLLADNCHLTRDTASVIRASGFAPQLLPPLPLKPGIGAIGKGSAASNGSSGRGSLDSGDILGSSSGGLPGGVNGSRDLWRFEVDGMGLIAPHVAGILTKPLL